MTQPNRESANTKTGMSRSFIPVASLACIGAAYLVYKTFFKQSSPSTNYNVNQVNDNLISKAKVILHRFPSWHDTSNMNTIHGSPFVCKLTIYLDYNNIPYEIDETKPFHPKTRKAPWITFNNEDIYDSQLCINYLNNKFGINMNDELSKQEKHIAHAFRIMIEDGLFWISVYRRLFDTNNVSNGNYDHDVDSHITHSEIATKDSDVIEDKNKDQGIIQDRQHQNEVIIKDENKELELPQLKQNDGAPAENSDANNGDGSDGVCNSYKFLRLNPILGKDVLSDEEKFNTTVEMINKHMAGFLDSQGLARHDCRTVYQFGDEIISSIVEFMLENNDGCVGYFFGNKKGMTEIDCVIYAFLAGMYQLPKEHFQWKNKDGELKYKKEINEYMSNIEISVYGQNKYWQDIC